jgi:hypothetical protein
MIDVTISISIAFIVYVWLRSNAFVEYFGWLLSHWNVFYLRDYIKSPHYLALEYPLWLVVTRPNFITKLISCPLCTSFWLNAFLFLPDVKMWLFSSYVSVMAFTILDKFYRHE